MRRESVDDAIDGGSVEEKKEWERAVKVGVILVVLVKKKVFPFRWVEC